MIKFPLGKFLAVNLLVLSKALLGTLLKCYSILWAIVLACHAATKNFATMMVTRFLLGCTEASLSPGFTLITSLWYRTSEQPLRAGIWFCGNSLSLIFGNLIAVGILQIKNSLKAWQVCSFEFFPTVKVSLISFAVAIHHLWACHLSVGHTNAFPTS